MSLETEGARSPSQTGVNALSPAGEQQPVATHVHIAGGDGPLSARDAARSLIDWRRKTAAGEGAQQTQQETGEGAATATADPAHESAAKADADPGAGEPRDPGETETTDPAATQHDELPPIEPPRSWTKDEKDRFATLPRETQEYLAQRETERDREFRRGQNEQAEARKAIEARHAEVEQARATYEQSLNMVLGHLQSAYANEFSDVRTMEDVQRLAVEDPLRYTKWDAQQKRIAAVNQEVSAAQHRAAAEAQYRFQAFKARETERFAAAAPEMADEGKRKTLMASAEAVLRDVSFADGELAQLWHGELGLSIHDHRFQLILRDAVRWRDAQKAKAELPTKKPNLPPVVRPGAAPDKGAQRAAEIKQLEANLDKATGMAALRAAAALTAARRRA